MYHPELYPELAAKNADIAPLKINPTLPKKEKKLKKPNNEIVVLKKANPSDPISSVGSEIYKLVKDAKKIHDNSYTSKAHISSILEEIKMIGVQNFVPNIQKDIEANSRFLKQSIIARREGRNLISEAFYSSDDEALTSRTGSNLHEMYAKEIKQENISIPLRELVKKMKKNNQLSSAIDFRSLPYEENNKIKENVKKVAALRDILNYKRKLLLQGSGNKNKSQPDEEESERIQNEIIAIENNMKNMEKITRREKKKNLKRSKNFSEIVKRLQNTKDKKKDVRKKKVKKVLLSRK
jgi:hypothetical protein